MYVPYVVVSKYDAPQSADLRVVSNQANPLSKMHRRIEKHGSLAVPQ